MEVPHPKRGAEEPSITGSELLIAFGRRRIGTPKPGMQVARDELTDTTLLQIEVEHLGRELHDTAFPAVFIFKIMSKDDRELASMCITDGNDGIFAEYDALNAEATDEMAVLTEAEIEARIVAFVARWHLNQHIGNFMYPEKKKTSLPRPFPGARERT